MTVCCVFSANGASGISVVNSADGSVTICDGTCTPPAPNRRNEPELTVGSGNRVVTGEYFDGGSDLGYNRMNFRWGNVGTFQISPGSHMWQVVSKHYKDDEPVPITMCFGLKNVFVKPG